MVSSKWKSLALRLENFFTAQRNSKEIKKVVFVMFASTILISTYVLSFPYLAKKFEYQEGEIAQEDIYVYRDLFYTDEQEAKELRQDAYNKQRYLFDRDYQVFKQIIDKLDHELKLFLFVPKNARGVSKIKKRLPFLRSARSINDQHILNTLRDRNIRRISEWASRYVTILFDSYGIINEKIDKLKNIDEVGLELRTINRSTDDFENLMWKPKQLIHSNNIFNYANYQELSTLHLREGTGFSRQIGSSAQKVIIHRVLQLAYRNPYVKYNRTLTEKLKLQAQNSVKPKKHLLKKGLIIVREGDPIDRESFDKIKILNKAHSTTNVNNILGVLLIQVAISFAVAFYISRFSEFKLRDISSNAILYSLILIYMVYTFILSRMAFFQDPKWSLALFTPSGMIGAIGTILLGTRVTFAIGVYLSFFIFFMSGLQTASLILTFVSIIGGIHAANRMEKRTQILQGIFTLSFTMALVVFGMALTSQGSDLDIANQIFIVFTNGLVCLSLTAGFLPIYESIFNLPTKFRLLELADSNNELLQKIVMEAPSTYTHTLMVMTLSERAVESLKGDSLLTRVGCLYHDIGKTIQPTFYAENRHLDEKAERFKKLGPAKSAQIIIAHVTDGIRLAREYRLPGKVISFIPEHHGTTTIQYFYHEALKKANHSKKMSVYKKDFQYPGPKPQSKETAVTMIADSVEAAARSLENPDKKNLEKTIDQIIQNKMLEDQFDECGLTIQDLKIIRKVFLDVLINSFHLRPKYPNMKETRSLEKFGTVYPTA